MTLLTRSKRRLLTPQILKAMKLVIILLTAAALQVSAKGYSQKVTLDMQNVSLEKVFKEIRKQTGYMFLYDNLVLKDVGKVSVKVKDADVEEALNQTLSSTLVTFSIVQGTIVVKSKPTVDLQSTNNIPPPRIDVHGRVENESGEPVLATITVKGSSKATATDADGNFTLTDLEENAILVITGVNIETREIKVGSEKDLVINVKTAVKPLDAVVVNKGYYTTSQRLNTGNVSKITGETIQKQPVSNPLAALEGRMTGVQITQATGVPGGGFSVLIRGQYSLRTFANSGIDANAPLYILDGVPFSPQSLSSTQNSGGIFLTSPSSLNNINISDIATIEILKDADATAIYGSRGANGVVLITTKKGKVGKTKVDVNVFSGWGKVAGKMDLMNTREYLDMRYEALRNDGATLTPTTPRTDDLRLWDTTRFTDWQKTLLGGTAKITNAQMSISGGNSNTQFLFGGGYYRESTVFPGDNNDTKASGHFNLSNTSQNNKFKATISSSYVVDKNTLPTQDLATISMNLAPIAPSLYDSLGNLNWANNTWTNPVSYVKQRYKATTQTSISNAVLSYQLFSGFQIKSSLGYTSITLREIYTLPISSKNPAFLPTATAFFTNGYANTWIIEPGAEYQKNVGHGKLSVLVGSTFQESIASRQTISASGFINDALLENIANAATLTKVENPYNQYRYNAVFGRIGYDWENKYLINITGRRDGSSRFGPGKQWANFGAVGLGWIFTENSFVRKRMNFLSYGKLRGSYGTSGSDQIGDYRFLDTYTTTSSPYNGISGLYPTGISNPNFSWETIKKLELALELGLLRDRILFNINWYRNRSSNQLVGYPLPLVTGFSSVQSNFAATVQNTGWEFELNAENFKNKNFSWTTAINISFPRNKLLSYPNIIASSYANTYAVGQSLFVKKLFPFAGVDPQTGIYAFFDSHGAVTSTPSATTDRQFIKEIAQDYYGGVSNSFKYKGLQLDILFQFIKQTGRNYSSLLNNPPGWVFQNRPTRDLSRWQKPGDLTTIEKFTQNPSSNAYSAWINMIGSNNAISDASFIRLKNLSISYQIDKLLTKKMSIEGLRLYLQAQNLFTISNYLGLDPETQSFALPPIKMITAGIQITF